MDILILAELLPSVILFIFWIRQATRQTNNLRQRLVQRGMHDEDAVKIGREEFQSSFLFEILIIGGINAIIILYHSENVNLDYRFEYWSIFIASFIILGVTCVGGNRFFNRDTFFVPFAVTASSVIGAQMGAIVFPDFAYVGFVNGFLLSFVVGILIVYLHKTRE